MVDPKLENIEKQFQKQNRTVSLVIWVYLAMHMGQLFVEEAGKKPWENLHEWSTNNNGNVDTRV